MDSLSIDDARAILMGQDILPLSEETVPYFQDDAVSEDDEEDRARAEDEAAFEAALDAAFGSEVAPQQIYDDGSVGLGVDIVEIERMKNILSRNPHFAERVFSEAECAYCNSCQNPAAHYAVRFAAKEAVVKALGTGFSGGIGVRDIEVERVKKGRPLVRLTGAAAQIAQESGVIDISLSMSYTKTDAVACALALTRTAAQVAEKRKDPTEELLKQFKETRKILDEL